MKGKAAMEPLDAVSQAIALHAGLLADARKQGDVAAERRWARLLEGLQIAAAALVSPQPAVTAPSADLMDLPPALLAQLSGPKTDELEDRILAIVRECVGMVDLNRLLIELYRRHGEIHDRKALNNKTYRMVQKGLIQQASDKRGAYSLPAPMPRRGPEPTTLTAHAADHPYIERRAPSSSRRRRKGDAPPTPDQPA